MDTHVLYSSSNRSKPSDQLRPTVFNRPTHSALQRHNWEVITISNSGHFCSAAHSRIFNVRINYSVVAWLRTRGASVNSFSVRTSAEPAQNLTPAKSQGECKQKPCTQVTSHPRTPSTAFRQPPPNSARFSYATEGVLFISAQLVHRRGQRPPNGSGTVHTPSIAFRHLPPNSDKTVEAT